MKTYLSHSVEETKQIAKDLATTLKGGETLLLDGDLGAGKTHFAKGLAEGLGIDELVTSPTFTLHNIYEGGRLTLNHFDFYRVDNPEDVEMLQDLVISAVNEAMRQAEDAMESSMQSLTGGLNIPGFGL